MLSVNTTVVHLEVKVSTQGLDINGLIGQGRDAWKAVRGELFEKVQEAHLERVLAGEEEIVCERCGVVHCGREGLARRGWRQRQVVAQDGKLQFRLRQVTCRDCGKTWSPYTARLGLRPRQRVLKEVLEKMLELVTHLSYGRTVELGESLLGASIGRYTLHRCVQERGAALGLTAAPEEKALIGDGTKIPVGERAQGEDVRIGFQLLGRSEEYGRVRAHLRVVGVGIGLRSWSQALPAHLDPKLVVTDAESGLRAFVREQYPQARHQLCEWHIPHTLDWSLIEDGVKKKQRQALQRLLTRTLFRNTTQQRKRRRYERIARWIGRISPTAQKQLQNAADLILYDTPSAERTSSLAERQMREVNRRMENGGRWSNPGALNLLKLRLAQQHNPDDYAQVWSRN